MGSSRSGFLHDWVRPVGVGNRNALFLLMKATQVCSGWGFYGVVPSKEHGYPEPPEPQLHIRLENTLQTELVRMS